MALNITQLDNLPEDLKPKKEMPGRYIESIIFPEKADTPFANHFATEYITAHGNNTDLVPDH